MLKQILQAYRTYSTMVAVEKDIRKMFKLAKEMYVASSEALLEQKEVEFDLYKRDRQINMLVVDIRIKIVEHLTVSASKNVSVELVFLKVITDLERVGDYSKNIMDLSKMLSSSLHNSNYLQRFIDIFRNLEIFFEKAENALFDGPEDEAYEVIKGHQSVNWSCEQTLVDLLKDKDISPSEGIAWALTARYFKRVSSHLKNVASTAVNPFSHIGYMQDPELKDD